MHNNTIFVLQRGLSNSQKIKIRIVTMAVATTGAIFNTAVILAIITDPLKTLRKGAWITILNLAIADLISCISGFCVFGWDFFKAIEESETEFAIFNFGWSFGISSSFLMLTFFTVQIYVITKFPLTSRFMFTDVKVVLITLAIWFFSFPLGLSYISYLKYPLEVGLKLWAAQICVLQIALLVQVILNISVTIEIMKSGRSTGNHSSQNNKHRNIAKTVIILTLVLLITAFPYLLFRQIEFIFRMGHFGDGKSAHILGSLSSCYVPIAVLNFTANPILYSLRLPDYRRTLLAFVGKIKSKGGRPLISTPNTSLKLTQTHASSFLRGSDRSSFQQSKRCSMERSSVPVSSAV